MNEKLLERKLRAKVGELGGVALKFASPYRTGMPDRIVLMPGGKTAWAEIKTTGKVPGPQQCIRIAELRDLGFEVDVVDSAETLERFIEKLKRL